jgi:hypothetical protein
MVTETDRRESRSVETPLTVAGRVAFWQQLNGRLARLDNRLDAAAQGKIRGDIHARIAMVTPDEQRALHGRPALPSSLREGPAGPCRLRRRRRRTHHGVRLLGSNRRAGRESWRRFMTRNGHQPRRQCIGDRNRYLSISAGEPP